MSEVRLIDANKLKEAFKTKFPFVTPNERYLTCKALDLINNAPTVEPEDLERTGYWETPEPDYARDGTRLPIRVAICSECQKPNKLPVGRYCSECGSRNKG